MIPELRLGVVVLTNQESGAAFNAIAYRVLDHYLGAKSPDYVGHLPAAGGSRTGLAAGRGRGQQAAGQRDSTAGTVAPARRYAGTYRDIWYGDVRSRRRAASPGHPLHEDAVDGGRPASTGSTTPSWRAGGTASSRRRIRHLRAQRRTGTIDQVRMAPASPAVDFSFDFQDLELKPVRILSLTEESGGCGYRQSSPK